MTTEHLDDAVLFFAKQQLGLDRKGLLFSLTLHYCGREQLTTRQAFSLFSFFIIITGLYSQYNGSLAVPYNKILTKH